jgi:hypothetical protein
MDAVEPSDRQPMRHRPAPNATGYELSPRDDPVVRGPELRDHEVR